MSTVWAKPAGLRDWGGQERKTGVGSGFCLMLNIEREEDPAATGQWF